MPLIVTGMAMEAALLQGGAARVVIGAGDCASLERKIAAELARRPAPLLSFGIAGGLGPRLAVGDCVIPDLILADGERFVCDEGWVARLRALSAAPGDNGPPPVAGPTPSAPGDRILLAGEDQPVGGAAAKAAHYAASGALAIDMESHVVARLGRRRGLPFAALRIISDSAGRDLPPAALIPLRADGKPHLAGILRSLARRPDQIGALLGLSRDLKVAMRALRAARDRLGESFAYSAAI